MGDSALASLRCKSRCGETGLGLAGSDEKGQAKVRHGLIDLSAEGFGPLRWVLWNPDLVCQVRDRKVTAKPVVVGISESGTGKDCRRQYGGLSLPTVLLGTGLVWWFRVSSVNAWLGTASRGSQGFG
jgi:hypothetical protein